MPNKFQKILETAQTENIDFRADWKKFKNNSVSPALLGT